VLADDIRSLSPYPRDGRHSVLLTRIAPIYHVFCSRQPRRTDGKQPDTAMFGQTSTHNSGVVRQEQLQICESVESVTTTCQYHSKTFLSGFMTLYPMKPLKNALSILPTTNIVASEYVPAVGTDGRSIFNVSEPHPNVLKVIQTGSRYPTLCMCLSFVPSMRVSL
jgi:hypothetical protein